MHVQGAGAAADEERGQAEGGARPEVQRAVGHEEDEVGHLVRVRVGVGVRVRVRVRVRVSQPSW